MERTGNREQLLEERRKRENKRTERTGNREGKRQSSVTVDVRL